MVGEPDQTGIVGRGRAEEERSRVLAGVRPFRRAVRAGRSTSGASASAAATPVSSARRAREAPRSRAAAWSRASARWYRRARPSVVSEARTTTGRSSLTTGPRRRPRQIAARTAAKQSCRAAQRQPSGTSSRKPRGSSGAADASGEEGRYQSRCGREPRSWSAREALPCSSSRSLCRMSEEPRRTVSGTPEVPSVAGARAGRRSKEGRPSEG